mmetsp:Transcript_27579/g.37811  ORF Transcript_27579/g.37811 Transcript_27579/m.37811 type:complete len:246 (-) Transcript_27579:996-1733(-)
MCYSRKFPPHLQHEGLLSLLLVMFFVLFHLLVLHALALLILLCYDQVVRLNDIFAFRLLRQIRDRGETHGGLFTFLFCSCSLLRTLPTCSIIFFSLPGNFRPFLRRSHQDIEEERDDNELENFLAREECLGTMLSTVELAWNHTHIFHRLLHFAAAHNPRHIMRHVLSIEDEEDVNAEPDRAKDHLQPIKDVRLEVLTARRLSLDLRCKDVVSQATRASVILGQVPDHEKAEPPVSAECDDGFLE